MKKWQTLSESDFLKRFFFVLSAVFVIASFCMPDREQLLSGLYRIQTQTCKVSTSYFAVGGVAATFLNMGLVGLVCAMLFCISGAKANAGSTLAVILTVGFSSWGINLVNIWPTIAGVCLYCLAGKQSFGRNVNAMVFSTGIAPLISDLLLRYPHAEAIGFNALGVVLGVAVGLLIGFLLPAGLAHSPKVHKGFDLYSAALPVGMTAFFLQAMLFKTPGVALPAAPAAETLKLAARFSCNVFCLAVFGGAVIIALCMGGKLGDYKKLLMNPETVGSFTTAYGNSTFLMNFGLFGLFILAYYNLIGATFNGVTFGIVFCMLCTCNSGSHPGNVWPIIAGYVLASFGFGAYSAAMGGSFTGAINAQAIVVGVCFANGLSPISQKFGWPSGILAGAMHYILVTSVPTLHGGYCLYNGGFTAALICIVLIPTLETFVLPRTERKAVK